MKPGGTEPLPKEAYVTKVGNQGCGVVSDAGSFRAQIKGAIGVAESEATKRGYPAEDVRLATFAVVAFLDESILNSGNPIFADWPRMSLQEELFGVHTAGEVLFNASTG